MTDPRSYVRGSLDSEASPPTGCSQEGHNSSHRKHAPNITNPHQVSFSVPAMKIIRHECDQVSQAASDHLAGRVNTECTEPTGTRKVNGCRKRAFMRDSERVGTAPTA